MNRIANLFLLITILVGSSQPTCAQKRQIQSRLSLGWDLTYSSVLKRNNIGRDEWLWGWLGRDYQSPVKSLVEGWHGEPIVFSILIEYPVFHAGEHIVQWFVRTRNRAYYWGYLDGKARGHVKESIKPEVFDRMFEQMFSWQQAGPQKPEDTPHGGVPGYLGFLSLYRGGDSRQLLLSQEDFFICEKKRCVGVDGENLSGVREGRVSLALKAMMKE
jgi:hypothetical protein